MWIICGSEAFYTIWQRWKTNDCFTVTYLNVQERLNRKSCAEQPVEGSQRLKPENDKHKCQEWNQFSIWCKRQYRLRVTMRNTLIRSQREPERPLRDQEMGYHQNTLTSDRRVVKHSVKLTSDVPGGKTDGSQLNPESETRTEKSWASVGERTTRHATWGVSAKVIHH